MQTAVAITHSYNMVYLLFFLLIFDFQYCYGTTNQFNQVSVTPIDQGRLFHKLGKVYASNSFSHLHYRYDLKGLNERAEFLSALNHGLRTLDVPAKMNPALAKEAKNRLNFIQLNSKIITDDSITRLNSALEALHSNFTLKSHNPLELVPKLSRKPRQVIIGAIIAGAIGGAVAGSIASEVSEEDVNKVIQQDSEVMSRTIQDNLVELQSHEEDIKQLNASLNEVTEEFTKQFLKIQSEEFEIVLLRSFNAIKTVSNTLNKVSKALSEARYGHLDLSTVNVNKIKNALIHLNQDSVSNGYQLSTINPLDLQECPSSYVIDAKKEVLHLIIHVALFQPHTYLNLYSFLDFPIPVTTKEKEKYYLELNPPKNLIALTLDNTKYLTLDQKDLADCQHRKDVNEYFCPLLTTYTRKRPDCLYSIFQNDPETIIQNHCPIILKKPYSKALRVAQNKWLICESGDSKLTINCEGESKLFELNSTVVLTMGSGCQAISDTIIIRNPHFESSTVVDGILTNGSFLDPESFMKMDDDQDEMANFTMTINSLLTNVGQQVSLQDVKRLTKYNAQLERIRMNNLFNFHFSLKHFIHGLLPSFTSIFMILMVVIMARFFWPIMQQRCMNKRRMAPPPRDAVSRPAGEEFPMRSTSAMSNEENQSMVWSQPN